MTKLSKRDDAMKIFIACDKFKGSLESGMVNTFLESGILAVGKNIKTTSLAMADGGEGSLSLLVENMAGNLGQTDSFDVFRKKISCDYFEDDNGNVYLESAKIIGLQMLKPEERNPLLTSTFGLGWTIKSLIQGGKKVIHLFCGGSSTNDGGAGILEGLGFQFLDSSGHNFSPNGGNLHRIHKIIRPKATELPEFTLHLRADVDIPLLGASGSSLMYSKQKGASEYEAELLENGLEHFVRMVEGCQGHKGIHMLGGAGAAGGIPFGCMSFLNCTLGKASDLLFECCHVEEKIASCDLVITGEGSFDRQSMQGKLVQQIAGIAKRYQTSCWVVCGQNLLENDDFIAMGISKVFSINEIQPDLDVAILNAGEYLEKIGMKIGEACHV